MNSSGGASFAASVVAAFNFFPVASATPVTPSTLKKFHLSIGIMGVI